MSGIEVIGAASGAATVLGVAMSLSPKGRDARRRAKQRREDLDGRPPRIENGREVEPARPSLAAAVHALTATVERIDERTEQLMRNSGTTLADTIHRIEAAAATNHERLTELRQIAGTAAAAAAAADQRAREAAAKIDVFTNVVASDTAHIWQVLKDHGLGDRRDQA